ncbi:MAG: DNA-deoxyinosine glycosylase [Gammaproteobacteria bacterium]|nr:DNA-deoxyinosine glycosylase [Gammaproteobacteria bacterium]
MAGDSRRAQGFAPIARENARILILGSLPGQRSIAAQQYYAHPQNAFWKIMAELLGAGGCYEQRCATLMESRIALWDVLANSLRPGSGDANIQIATAVANDFDTFLTLLPALDRILFNGKKAAEVFERKVLPGLVQCDIRRLVLPSTSPAYALMNYAEKLARWRAALS